MLSYTWLLCHYIYIIVSSAQSPPCKANVLVGFLHCCVNENDQTWDVMWDIEQMMLSFCTKTLMKLCEGFGTPIIADHIHDKERFLSWVVFVLRENIENIFLKPSWGSYQIKQFCVDGINVITFDINLCVCTMYGPAVQYVFNIYNLSKGQLLDWTFVAIVHWCFCSNTTYLGFMVLWSYKLFFLSFWPNKIRSHK